MIAPTAMDFGADETVASGTDESVPYERPLVAAES